MFKLGNKVEFLDEVGVFEIVKVISTNIFIVEDEHGFERECSINEISPYESKAFDNVSIETYENRNVKTNPFAKKNKKSINIPVIDLHIENILNSHGHMANHEIVIHQLDYFKYHLDKKINAGVTQLSVVHGIGNGRLKEEVRYILDSYPNIEYMDEHYSERGMGATKVFIK